MRYLDKGGADYQLKILLVQSYYLSNDFAKAASYLQEINRTDEAAGKVTAENQLQLWASCEVKQNRLAGVVTTLEKLATHYPKKEYWNDLIRQLQRTPEFSERLSLDAYRLQRYAGSLDGAEEIMEMAGMSLQAGFPVEAKKAIDQGYADKLLGSATDAAKHKKLQDQANKGLADDLKVMAQDEKRAEAAKTGLTPVNTGFKLAMRRARGLDLCLGFPGRRRSLFHFPALAGKRHGACAATVGILHRNKQCGYQRNLNSDITSPISSCGR